MKVLSEADLRVVLPRGARARKFDDESTHGLSHCMKAVDFIVEFDDKILFVEFKDPENPNAQAANRDAFLAQFKSGKLARDLGIKYRDSWLYETAEGRAAKPIYYYVLLGASNLSSAELLAGTEALKRQIPIEGPAGRAWKKPFVAGCAVMNLAAWNRRLPDYPANRVSAITGGGV